MLVFDVLVPSSGFCEKRSHWDIGAIDIHYGRFVVSSLSTAVLTLEALRVQDSNTLQVPVITY